MFDSGTGVDSRLAPLSFLLQGHGYEIYSTSTNLQGMKPISAEAFGDLKSSLDKVIHSLTQKLLHVNREYVRAEFGDSLVVTVDMRWQQRGENSDQGTLAVMCYKTGLVLFRYHFKRDRSREEDDPKVCASAYS